MTRPPRNHASRPWTTVMSFDAIVARLRPDDACWYAHEVHVAALRDRWPSTETKELAGQAARWWRRLEG